MTTFLVVTVLLTVVSAVLAWFALTKRPPPPVLADPDADGWRGLAEELGLEPRLDGPPSTWELVAEGRRIWVVEVDRERWTRVGRRLVEGESCSEGAAPVGPFVEDGWLVATVVDCRVEDVRPWAARVLGA